MSIIEKKIILWGVGDTEKKTTDFFNSYVNILKELPLNILFAVDLHNYNNKFEEIKIISQKDAISLIHEYSEKDIAIIITAMFKDKSSAFKKVTDILVNRLNISENIIYHPSVVLPFIKAEYSGKIVNFGFPGSGNTILTKLLEKIMFHTNYNKNSTLMEKEKFTESLAIQYERIVDELISDELSKSGSSKFLCMNNKLEAVSYKAILKNKLNHDTYLFFMYETLFQHMIHEGGYTSPCYIFPTIPVQDIVEKFIIKDYKFFTPIRNPLDIIVSNAYKIEEYIVSSVDDSLIKAGKSNFRDNFAASRLYNYNWFEDMANIVKKHYLELLSIKNDTYCIKYEDLLDNPTKQINNILETLNLQLSEAKKETIWSDIAFKPLNPNTPTNFNDPSINKHKKLFTKKHSEILEKLGFIELLSDLNYDSNIYFDNSEIIVNSTAKLDKIVYLHDYFQNYLYGKKLSFDDNYINSFSNGRLKIFSEDKILIDNIKVFFENKYITAILNT